MARIDLIASILISTAFALGVAALRAHFG